LGFYIDAKQPLQVENMVVLVVGNMIAFDIMKRELMFNNIY